MRKIFTLALAFLASLSINAQVGATAPDFTVTDIDGVEHNLYSILDNGKVVILDCSATWCSPCWAMHEAHFLNDLNAQFGPDGTDQIRVIFYEADANTTMADLNGSGSNTQGDWITGSTYPMVNESPLTLSGNTFWPLGFPTVNVINAQTKVIDADLWDPWSQNQGDDAAALAAMIEIVETSIGDITSIEENDPFEAVVFPNPSQGDVSLSFVSEEAGNLFVEVYSQTGQLVHSENVAAVSGNNLIELSLQNLATGNYQLRLSNDKTVSNTTIQLF